MSLKKIIKACLPYGLVSSFQKKEKPEDKHRKILNTLAKDYASILSEYKNRNDTAEDFQQPYPVWVCWWQGEDAMPEVIKMCYTQLLKNANGHQINLITKNNYKDFITLPDYILKKVRDDKGKFSNGFISLTHLSDIIRVTLLAQYGGLWIDATLYTFKNLPDFGSELFSLRRLNTKDMVGESRWSGFFLYAGKSRKLFNFVKDLFFAYWKNNDQIIDFFFIDYCMMLAYKHLPDIKTMIDDIPFSNPNIFWLNHRMNEVYDSASFEELMKTTQFCKLSYKKKHQGHERTDDGLLTYYGYLKKNTEIQ